MSIKTITKTQQAAFACGDIQDRKDKHTCVVGVEGNTDPIKVSIVHSGKKGPNPQWEILVLASTDKQRRKIMGKSFHFKVRARSEGEAWKKARAIVLDRRPGLDGIGKVGIRKTTSKCVGLVKSGPKKGKLKKGYKFKRGKKCPVKA